MILKVALLQMSSLGWDQQASLSKGDAFCRRAKEADADVALFPEMWNVGYTLCDPNDSHQIDIWRDLAIDQNHPYFIHFRDLAKELDMAIALTYLEAGSVLGHNAVSLIDRRGKRLFTYRKVHTCDFDAEKWLMPGDSFHVGELQTDKGSVRVGAMICFDREFPEAARILMLRGAEVILTPNACEIDQNRRAQFQARAFENMVAVAMANYVAPTGNGHSIAFNGVAYDADGNSLDMEIIEAGEDDGVHIATFDLDRLRAYRAREVWGNAYRKPRTYTHLTSIDVADPFVRADARRLRESIELEVASRREKAPSRELVVGEPIPECIPACAQRLLARPEWFTDPSVVTRARLREAGWFARFLSSRLFSGTETAAITLGRSIHIRKIDAYNPHTPSGLALLAHEAKHIEQYEREGWLRFYAKYLWAYLLHGYGGSIPFEGEAYEFARKVMTHLVKEYNHNYGYKSCQEMTEPHNPNYVFIKTVPDEFNFPV